MSAAFAAGALILAASLALVALPAPFAAAPARRAAFLAWRNRLASALFVVGVLVAVEAAFPARALRIGVEQLLVVTLGYGHLLSALVLARARRPAPQPAAGGRGAAALVPLAAVACFAAYWGAFALLLDGWVAFLTPWILINVWHILENDLLLGRAYRERMRLAPLPRSAAHHGLAIGLFAAVLAIALAIVPLHHPFPGLRGALFPDVGPGAARAVALACGVFLLLRAPLRPHRWAGGALLLGALAIPERMAEGRWMSHATLFGGLTLYHLVSWLVFTLDKTRAGPAAAARRTWLRVGLLHAPFAALCTLLFLVPRGPLQLALFLGLGWASYLYWSVLHVFQTLHDRGLQTLPRAPRELEPREEGLVSHDGGLALGGMR